MGISTPESPPWTDRRFSQLRLTPSKRREFALDRDRILHSRAFRRMQHKTQVFVVTEADFFRTRITHSIEVAQIGRSIAYELGLDETLAEAIALAHDLGHGPFGHEGERVLDELMRERGGWNANEHSLEVVDELESPHPHYRGMNLTWATREGIARHATRFDVPSDDPEFTRFAQPGPEAQAVSQADECAYVAHDVEDAVNAGLLRLETLAGEGPSIWRNAIVGAQEMCRAGSREDLRMDRDRVILRRATSNVIGKLIGDIVAASERRLGENGLESSEAIRRFPEPAIGPPERESKLRDEAAEFMMKHVYQHPAVLRQASRGRMVLRRLFEAFVESPSLLPRSTQEKLRAPGADRHTVVATFLAGMTDRFALDTYSEIFEPLHRALTGRPD